MTRLTDEQIDDIIKSCPGEGYALMSSSEMTLEQFRATVRLWARAIEAELAQQADTVHERGHMHVFVSDGQIGVCKICGERRVAT